MGQYIQTNRTRIIVMKLSWDKVVIKEQELDAVKKLAMDPDGTVVIVFESIEDGHQIEAHDAEEFRA